MVTINKDALARKLSDRTGRPTLTEARETIEALCDIVREEAEAGATVRVAGFGSFSVRARAARNGSNPQTGEPMRIPETRRLVFKAARRE